MFFITDIPGKLVVTDKTCHSLVQFLHVRLNIIYLTPILLLTLDENVGLLERLIRGKHSGLFVRNVGDEDKEVYDLDR